MAESADNPFAAMARDMASAADEFGAGVVAAVRKDVSIPVEYVGGRVIRSRPGEHPRMETGNLYNSITHRVTVDGLSVAVEVDAPVFYSGYLQDDMNRPITRDVPDEFGDEWADTCARVASEPGFN